MPGSEQRWVRCRCFEDEEGLWADGLECGDGGLQGCASIVHVEGTVTGSAAAVTARVSFEVVIAVATGCLGMWLVAGSWGGPRACSQGDK